MEFHGAIKGEDMEHTAELVPRILRDIDDSVLALDARGHITYMNEQCRALLGVGSGAIGDTYAEVFFDSGRENDAFHQFVVDAVCKKEEKHIGTVKFTDTSGKIKHLHITSSFLKGDGDAGGVVLVISDVTETETLKKKKHDASIVFACVTACVCLYLFLLALLDFLKIPVPTKVLTQVINGMVLLFSIVIYRKTKFTVDELGLKVRDCKYTFGTSLLASAGIVVLLMGAKLLVMQISPNFFAVDAPFWNWNIGVYSWVSYIFTCTIQEFLARSMIYGSIKKMFDGRYATLVAILLSSLLFGAVHIAHGFMYMGAAIILLGSLGGLYEKHGNIWGVTIIHFVLGQAACCLGFLS